MLMKREAGGCTAYIRKAHFAIQLVDQHPHQRQPELLGITCSRNDPHTAPIVADLDANLFVLTL
jgi:hypothetical protein